MRTERTKNRDAIVLSKIGPHGCDFGTKRRRGFWKRCYDRNRIQMTSPTAEPDTLAMRALQRIEVEQPIREDLPLGNWIAAS